MSVITSQAVAIGQLPLIAIEEVLKVQSGTDCKRDFPQSSQRRSERSNELDGTARPLKSEFFLLLRAELEKSAGRAVTR